VEPDARGEVGTLAQEGLQRGSIRWRHRTDDIKGPCRRLLDGLQHHEQAPSRPDISDVHGTRLRVRRRHCGKAAHIWQVAHDEAVTRLKGWYLVVRDDCQVGGTSTPGCRSSDHPSHSHAGSARPSAIVQHSQVVLIDIDGDRPPPKASHGNGNCRRRRLDRQHEATPGDEGQGRGNKWAP
jgi:hypothetical protein